MFKIVVEHRFIGCDFGHGDVLQELADQVATLTSEIRIMATKLEELKATAAALQASLPDIVGKLDTIEAYVRDGVPALVALKVAEALAAFDVDVGDINAHLATIEPSITKEIQDVLDAADLNPEPPIVVVTLDTTSVGGVAGEALTGALSASGGTAPYTFAADASWPTDISLSADGSYSGTPATFAGTSVVTATDANGVSSSPTTVSISIT